MLYGDWQEILSTAQLNAAQLNAVHFDAIQLSIVQFSVAQEDNIISQIKEQLASKNYDAYSEWKAHDFNVNCLFLLNVGYKCTLLHISACYGLGDIVRALLKKGAEIDAADQYGKTSLYLAADNGHKGVVNILLQEGANVNAVSHDGTIPLHCAVGNNYVGIVNVLLEKGARVNAIGQDGVAPLHIAAENSNLDIINALLKKGANPLLRNKYGRTPKDLTWSTSLRTVLARAERIQLLRLIIIKGIAAGCLTAAFGIVMAAGFINKKYITAEAVPIMLTVITIVAIALTVGVTVYKNLKPSTQVNEVQTAERRNSRHLEISTVL